MWKNRNRSRAWMLGPKAENVEMFERLLSSAFSDYCHWRRNFHPEDLPYVKAKDRLSPGYNEFYEKLNDRLFEMLSHLKLSVPFFSPRYLGHMNTDLLIPSLLGYMSAMLYNQNNIVQEAAPVTQRLESEAMKMVAEMLMLPKETAWGHLCSGGSAANTEGLWIARQVALFPFQVALARKKTEDYAELIGSLECGGGRSFRHFVDGGFLKSMSIADTLKLAESVRIMVVGNPEVAKVLNRFSMESLGLVRFHQEASSALGDQYPKRFCIVLSRNAHYSLKKSAGMLGLGQADLQLIDLDENFRMRVKEFEGAVTEVVENGGKVIAGVGVYGSTEEGAIDDFGQMVKFRDQQLRKKKKGDFWLHADACYGGYALAMAAPEKNAQEEISQLMEEIAADSLEIENHNIPVWSKERIGCWLKKSKAIGSVDSIALDPHKLGYVPYPAGAILLRDFQSREFIRCDAPYLNATPPSTDDPQRKIWDQAYLGRYTLEGSRPGACGAALWLAHATIPLDRNGHGRIVAESILSAEALREALAENEDSKHEKVVVKCIPLGEESDLNILCYSFNAQIGGEAATLSQVNRAVGILYNNWLPSEKAPTHTKNFVIAKTTMSMEEYEETLPQIAKGLGLRGELFSTQEFGEQGNPWRDAVGLDVVRSVVMGPFLLHAETRERFASDPKSLIGVYTDFLMEEFSRILLETGAKPLFGLGSEMEKPFLKGDVLVLEDDHRTREDLVTALRGDYGFISNPKGKIIDCSTRKRAGSSLNKKNISAALVDVNLGSGDGFGGLDFLYDATKINSFRGAVIFTGENFSLDSEIGSRIENLRKVRPDWLLTVQAKPDLVGDNKGKFGFAINRVFEDLWDIQNSHRIEQ